MAMRAATLFSGIGAPEVAMPAWSWLWHAEIEKFPSAVMSVRHPSSVNLRDVTAHDFVERALVIGRPDVVVFGSPCQSYSVAGQRLGLDDPRGNLALIALGIVERLRPTWFVFENVPGLFSSWSGAQDGPDAPGSEWDGEESSDLDAFFATVRDIGYQCAWAELDAQYAGLAQRRERLFVVGHARDWRRAAAVLLESESLCGHPPARDEAREDVAGTLASRTSAGGGLCTDFDIAGGCVPVHPTLNAGGNSTGGPRQPGMSADTAEGLVVVSSTGERARALTTSNQRIDFETETLIAVCDPNQVTSKANRSRPYPELSHPLSAQPNAPIAYAIGSHAGCAEGDQTNRSHDAGGPVGMNVSEELAYAVRASRPQGVAFGFSNTAGETNQAFTEEQAPPVTTRHGDPGMVLPVAFRGRDGGTQAELGGDVSTALRSAGGSGSKASALTRMGVRRLMPVETERLQGFPDNYTAITYRGKPAADGPRYKAVGNSMAVTVIGGILRKIELLEQLVPEHSSSKSAKPRRIA